MELYRATPLARQPFFMINTLRLRQLTNSPRCCGSSDSVGPAPQLIPQGARTGTMRHALRAAVPLFVLLLAASPAPAQQFVVLVRHAEKEAGTGDVALSDAGRKRAEAL